MASVLLVLARGAGDPFEVNTRFCAALEIPIMLMSVNVGSDPGSRGSPFQMMWWEQKGWQIPQQVKCH